MKKFTCTMCGYTHEGDAAPDKCPHCGAAKDKFTEMLGDSLAWADQHEVGVAQGCDKEIMEGLKANLAHKPSGNDRAQIKAVFANVLRQVDRTQVTDSNFVFAGVQGDLGAQV